MFFFIDKSKAVPVTTAPDQPSRSVPIDVDGEPTPAAAVEIIEKVKLEDDEYRLNQMGEQSYYG